MVEAACSSVMLCWRYQVAVLTVERVKASEALVDLVEKVVGLCCEVVTQQNYMLLSGWAAGIGESGDLVLDTHPANRLRVSVRIVLAADIDARDEAVICGPSEDDERTGAAHETLEGFGFRDVTDIDALRRVALIAVKSLARLQAPCGRESV